MVLDWDLHQVDTIKGIIKVQFIQLPVILGFCDKCLDGILYVSEEL